MASHVLLQVSGAGWQGLYNRFQPQRANGGNSAEQFRAFNPKIRIEIKIRNALRNKKTGLCGENPKRRTTPDYNVRLCCEFIIFWMLGIEIKLDVGMYIVFVISLMAT